MYIILAHMDTTYILIINSYTNWYNYHNFTQTLIKKTWSDGYLVFVNH